MNSEITMPHSHRKIDFQVVSKEDKTLMGTSPYIEPNELSFHAGDAVEILYYMGKVIFSFKAVFSNVKLIDGVPHYIFHIETFYMTENLRKEKRKNVELKAMIATEHAYIQGVILDISMQGLRIETTRDLRQKELSVQFEAEGKECSSLYTVVWEKNIEGKYFYGLKTA